MKLFNLIKLLEGQGSECNLLINNIISSDEKGRVVNLDLVLDKLNAIIEGKKASFRKDSRGTVNTKKLKEQKNDLSLLLEGYLDLSRAEGKREFFHDITRMKKLKGQVEDIVTLVESISLQELARVKFQLDVLNEDEALQELKTAQESKFPNDQKELDAIENYVIENGLSDNVRALMKKIFSFHTQIKDIVSKEAGSDDIMELLAYLRPTNLKQNSAVGMTIDSLIAWLAPIGSGCWVLQQHLTQFYSCLNPAIQLAALDGFKSKIDELTTDYSDKIDHASVNINNALQKQKKYLTKKINDELKENDYLRTRHTLRGLFDDHALTNVDRLANRADLIISDPLVSKGTKENLIRYRGVKEMSDTINMQTGKSRIYALRNCAAKLNDYEKEIHSFRNAHDDSFIDVVKSGFEKFAAFFGWESQVVKSTNKLHGLFACVTKAPKALAKVTKEVECIFFTRY